MKLEQFIKTKPDGVRLGQHFYNCYFSRLGWDTNLHHNTQRLYNTTKDIEAVYIIGAIMHDYRWPELPDLEQVPGLPVRWQVCAE